MTIPPSIDGGEGTAARTRIARRLRAAPAWARHSVAVAVIAAATLVRLGLVPLTGLHAPFFVFFPVVFMVAWGAGLGPGVLAASLASLVSHVLFVEPQGGGGALATTVLLWATATATAYVADALYVAGARVARAARDLEGERARLEALVGSIPGVVWESSGAPGSEEERATYVSPYAETMFGHPRSAWLGGGGTWADLVHPDDRERVVADATEIFESRRPGLLELRCIAKDGRTVWVHAHASVVLDARCEPVGMRGVAVDVTAQKLAEIRMSLVADLSHELAELGVPVPALAQRIAETTVGVLGEGCMVFLLEDEGLRAIGFHHVDARMHPLLAALAAQQIPRSDPRTQRVLERAAYIEHSLAIDPAPLGPVERTLLEGSPPERAMIVPLVARDRVIGAMAIVRHTRAPYETADLQVAEAIGARAALALDNARLFEEAQHARRAAERASRLKDEFLTTLSHELRTPLNAIVGWSHMLRAGRLAGPEATRAGEVIHRNALAQAQIVSDILDVQRLVLGELKLHARGIDLGDVVRAAIEAVRATADAKGMTIDARIDPDATEAWGDAERLQQVVWNLLSNAVKFGAEHGHVRVRLERAGSHLEIEVEDDGPGIDPAFLPFVFDRFRQADASVTRRHGGLGLGLSIVKSLVELHGGEVRAGKAASGTGAAFVVSLPRPAVVGAAKRPDARVPAWIDEAPRLDGASARAADDDADARNA